MSFHQLKHTRPVSEAGYGPSIEDALHIFLLVTERLSLESKPQLPSGRGDVLHLSYGLAVESVNDWAALCSSLN